jgi:hypothetical protein
MQRQRRDMEAECRMTLRRLPHLSKWLKLSFEEKVLISPAK